MKSKVERELEREVWRWRLLAVAAMAVGLCMGLLLAFRTF